MTGVQTCALPICFPVTIYGGGGGGNTSESQISAALKNTFTDFGAVNAITSAKGSYDQLNSGRFTGNKNNFSYEYTGKGNTILEFVKDNSTGFQKDIAERALDKQMPMSEKQAWAVSYEFIKLKPKYEEWAIKKYGNK